jgi:hypothetical protein
MAVRDADYNAIAMPKDDVKSGKPATGDDRRR